MSEQINKVLADRPQSFSSAEQAQARENIGAMAASASSLFYPVSNPSAFVSGVSHDDNLSGNGRTSPLGLNTSITLARNGESATLAYDHLTLAYSDSDPILSASNSDIYISGHAGNASSPYTANYGLQGMHIYGTDTYNNITATASVYYSGAEFQQGADSANIKATGMTLHTVTDGDQLVDASSVARWNSYSSMSSFTGCSANNCISGDGTSALPLGLSATARWTGGPDWYPMTEISAGHLKISARAFASAQVYHNESSLCNWTPTGITVRHPASGIGDGNIDSIYGEIINLNYNAGDYYLHQISSDASGLRAKWNGNPNRVAIFGFGSAAFSDDREDSWEVVDPSSIRRWNGYSAMSVSAGNGITGDGTTGSPLGLSGKIHLENSYSALELQPNYILVNNHVGSSQIGNAYLRLTNPLNGGSTAHLNDRALTFTDSANHTAQVNISSIDRWNSNARQQNYYTYLFHVTGSAVHDLDTGIYPTGLTADARLDFVNLCSAASANVKTDTFHGDTAIFNPGQSATMWYIATADIWTNGIDPVPV